MKFDTGDVFEIPLLTVNPFRRDGLDRAHIIEKTATKNMWPYKQLLPSAVLQIYTNISRSYWMLKTKSWFQLKNCSFSLPWYLHYLHYHLHCKKILILLPVTSAHTFPILCEIRSVNINTECWHSVILWAYWYNTLLYLFAKYCHPIMFSL